MAKYVTTLKGTLNSFIPYLQNQILSGSLSASLEDSYERTVNDIRILVQVYERYSAVGSNRVSLTVTLIENGENIELAAITSGGSQALFFKINTWGEETFLEQLKESINRYKS